MKIGEVYDLNEMGKELLDKGITNFIVAPFPQDCSEIVIQYKTFSPDEFLEELENKAEKLIDKMGDIEFTDTMTDSMYEKKVEEYKSKNTLVTFIANELLRHTGEKINMKRYLSKEDSKIKILGDIAVEISDYPKPGMSKIYADEEKTRKSVEHPNAEKFFLAENFRLRWPPYNTNAD
ncbi:MAG: hypothetical protein JSV92_02705 [archaeon]|nr:MAG: hypothetical protein JSV92_02705 [archaeon]